MTISFRTNGHAALVGLAASILTTSPSNADWSTSPTEGNAICVAAGDQGQPKLAPAPNGGVYIAWFDNRGGGYDMYIQHLDASGTALFAANGLQVADLSYSSTQDYGFASDSEGRAYLTFQDDRLGGLRATVTAVDPDGSFPWGTGGVQVSPVGQSINQPSLGVTDDGDIVAAWNGGAATSYVHRLNRDGTLAWPAAIAIGGAGNQIASGVASGGADGSAIVSVVHYTTFQGAKTLKAQRFAADGTTMWGSVTVPVFTTGSLQFGNFPGVKSDGAGGAVFAYYTVSPLQSYAQRLDASGNRLWAGNGMAVTATSTGVERTAPDVVFDAATGTTYVGWDQGLAPPSTSNGSAVQAFDTAGNRLWGDNGRAIYALSTATYDTFWTRVGLLNGQLIAGSLRWSTATTSSLGSLLYDDVGPVWGPSPLAVNSAAGSQSRPQVLGVGDGAIWVWQDSRNGNNDIYAARQNADGSLGPPSSGNPADINGDGTIDGADLALLLGAWGTADGAADINGSGLVDGADLTLLLSAWGA